MGIQIAPESALGQELAKWEQPNYNPANHPYPKMLYKAFVRPSDGRNVCMAPPVHPYGYTPEAYQAASIEVEDFNRRCQKIVKDEAEEAIAKGQGWRNSAREAVEALDQEQIEFGNIAAEAQFQARRMSEKAQAELAAADAQTHAHVVDVQPARRRRTRTRKPAPAVRPVTQEPMPETDTE